jgi:hypothetical protein
MKARHANLYHKVSREQFDAAVADLDRSIPQLQRNQIIVGMMRIAAMVGDAHTRVDPRKDKAFGFRSLPLKLYLFDDGLYVRAAASGQPAELLGAKVEAIGGVPVADYAAAYEDESPILQAMDRALFGGSPEDVPALFHERNPLTYVDQVSVPLLILAGENDSRCPIRQVWNYVGALRARGLEPEVYTYATGHASFDVEERVRQTAIVLDFLARTVPGATRLEGIDAHLVAAGHPRSAGTDALSPA